MTSKSEIFKVLESVGIISETEREEIEKVFEKKEVTALLSKNGTEHEHKEISKEVIVSEVLREIGVPCHIKGYRYLKACILFIFDEPSALEQVTKVLYPKIAKMYNATPSRVERAIRHAIEVAWDRGNIEMHSEIFGYTVDSRRGKPTNSEFIAGVVEYIKVYLM